MAEEADEVTKLRARIEALEQEKRPRKWGRNLLIFGGVAVVGILVATMMGTINSAKRFEGACSEVVPSAHVEDCMFDLGRVYRGPNNEANYRNAAAQWAADNGYGPT